jgi:hypothetical protein
MEHNIQTIEDLARLIQNTMASKEDIQELREEMDEWFERVDARFEKIEGRLDHLDARVGRIEADIHELRDEVVRRHEFDDALARIKYLEKKLGIESGV